jgi:hypothetical protein
MSTLSDLERRRQKRVKVQLPVRLDFNNAEGLAATKNISLLGACLNINREILPGTRVALSLEIPKYVEDQSLIGEIKGEGAVVRCEPEEKEGRPDNYELGVFFSSFMPPGEDKLLHYLDHVAEEEEKQIRAWVEQYRAHIKQRKKEIAKKKRDIEKKREVRLAKKMKKELAKANKTKRAKKQ